MNFEWDWHQIQEKLYEALWQHKAGNYIVQFKCPNQEGAEALMVRSFGLEALHHYVKNNHPGCQVLKVIYRGDSTHILD